MLETTKIPQANSVLYHNNFVFSQDLVERFYQDGFLVIDHIFSESEMIALNDVLSRPLAKNKAGGGQHNWPLHSLEATKNPDFKKLAFDKRITELLRPLLGEHIQLQHSKFAVKPPGEKKGTIHWHQDFAFFPHSNDSLLAVAISLTDVTPENGGMIMIRGSHQHGLCNHFNSDGSFAEKCTDESICNSSSRYVYVCPKIGGISIHHCLMVHCSLDNLTQSSRNLVVYEYRASDAYQFADGVWEDTGLQIVGQPSSTIRLGGKFLKKNFSNEILLPLPRSDRYGALLPFGHAYQQVGEMAKAESGFYF